jgi:hypothetical protein
MISFDEATHTYSIDGDTTYMSVTTLLSTWFKKFDAIKTIRGMKARPDWPQSKYYGMTDEAIQEKWSSDGKLAADLGTDMHACIELYFKNTPRSNDSVEYNYFLQFVNDTELTTHAVEWRLFHSPVKLVGTIDYASVNKDGTIDLYDWKRTKDLNASNGYCLVPELSHIPNTNFWKYTLQLNLYKYLVEKNGHKVRRMFIVCFHPNNLSYQKYQVADLELENVLNRIRCVTSCGSLSGSNSDLPVGSTSGCILSPK